MHGYQIYIFKQPLEDFQIRKTWKMISDNIENPGSNLSASLSNPPLYENSGKTKPTRSSAVCAPRAPGISWLMNPQF